MTSVSSGVRGVIFDFDLTLVESTDGVAHCANHALRALGLPAVTVEEVRRTIGLPLSLSFRALAGTDDPALTLAYVEAYRARADLVMAGMVRFLPGVAETLGQLRERGCRTAIVSSRFRYRIAAMLEQATLAWAIDLIVGAEDVVLPKPDPEGIQRALRELDVPASQALYVGDHQVDADAAQAAGVPFVAVLTGVTGMDEWRQRAPFAVIESVADLPQLMAMAQRQHL